MIRYEFIDSSVRGEDIHPDSIFQNERLMAREFVSKLAFPEDILPCPCCGKPRNEILFERWGCRYAICPNTWTVGLAAMPDSGVWKDYFFASELARFRASIDYQDVAAQRRLDLWEGQISWIEGRANRYLGNDKYTVIDWCTKAVGWIENLGQSGFVETLVVKEPLPPINVSGDFDAPADIVCLMDVLQRQIDPLNFLKRVYQSVRSGGLVFSTCRAGSGFDVLTLRQKSESIFPLDHIVLPSPEGLQVLFKNAGFEVLELTTPGLLDMKFVKDVFPDIPADQYFLRYIMDRHDDLLFERTQSFLQRNNLSSHMRCVARKH